MNEIAGQAITQEEPMTVRPKSFLIYVVAYIEPIVKKLDYTSILDFRTWLLIEYETRDDQSLVVFCQKYNG